MLFNREFTPQLAVGAAITVYLAAALLVALPFWLTGVLSPLDALFEGVSTATLTGMTALASPDLVPGLLLAWRTLVLWLMGLVTVLLFVAVLPRYLHSPYLLFADRENGYYHWQLFPDLSQAFKNLGQIYGLATLVLVGGLWLTGSDFFHSFHYGIGALTTAGFPLHQGPVIGQLTTGGELWLALGMFCSGGSYALYYTVWKQGRQAFWQDEEWRTYVGLAVLGTLAIGFQLWYMSHGDCGPVQIFFQVASYASTTGYAVTDVYLWPVFCRLILAVFLFLGACAGSTAGGLKIYRGLLLVKGFDYDIRHVFHPTIAEGVDSNGSFIKTQTLTYTEFFFVFNIMAVILVASLLAWQDFGAIDSIFTAMAALSNSGGIITAAAHSGSYLAVSSLGKLGLILGMLLGRTEIFLILVLFLPEFWQKNKQW